MFKSPLRYHFHLPLWRFGLPALQNRLPPSWRQALRAVADFERAKVEDENGFWVRKKRQAELRFGHVSMLGILDRTMSLN